MPLRPTRLVLALATAFCAPFALADEPVVLTTPDVKPDQTHVTADDLSGTMDEVLKARGDVVVTRNDQTVNADWLDYYQDKNRVKAGDRFTLTQPGAVVTGHDLDYYLDSRTGKASDATFDAQTQTGPKRRLRGDGQEIGFEGPDQYQLRQARFNTCSPGDDTWYIKASAIDLDYDRNVGVAHHAHLEFEGVPVFYTPWIDFPLDGGRKSGVLAPVISGGSDGFGIDIPYYFNLAPNYDATLTARYNAKRGAGVAGEFRYLEPSYRGTLYTEQMPNDRTTDSSRWLWNGTHSQTLLPGLSFNYIATQVSDDNYFKDFGNRQTIADSTNLDREAWFNYGFNVAGIGGSAMLRWQRYQTLQQDPLSPVTPPYARLPQLTLNLNKSLEDGPSANLASEWTYFSSDVQQSGRRFVAYPSVTWRLDKSWGYVQPKIGFHYTEYSLDSFAGSSIASAAPSSTQTRELPITSIDSGLYFDRDTSFFGRDHTQTLEPRLYYVYIPTKAQNTLPNFDTSENDINYAQLFTENRFSGSDRINGANQVTAGLTSRLIDNEGGLERLRLTFAQRYYFTRDDINLAGNTTQRTGSGSDFLLGAGGDLTRAWRFDSNYQYSQADSHTDQVTASLRYNPAPGKTLSARYRYGYNQDVDINNNPETLRQVDLGAQWPIARRWYGLARLNYSLNQRKPLEQLAGFEYNDGCWTLRLVGQRYVTDLVNVKTKFYVQVELKDLAGIGSNPLNTLRLSIPGYSKINETSNDF
ncbi:LPS-assembly protein LptD [Crenobacter sp. SG2303]|uniref:LPS-assembly protein LptD n=1 Tax=Crenobacter oryzisoli TaxID=3056844 RepID=A0ABT7XPK4_9NEIS|nr:LPS-assembly protein LptD [Crenobacter sp. SG2303]MDN0075720.1 LPS-assembly protein LptD [Crenobacter sp. SG2303]